MAKHGYQFFGRPAPPYKTSLPKKSQHVVEKPTQTFNNLCLWNIFFPTIIKRFRYPNGTLLTYIKMASYKFQGSSILGTCKFLVKQTSSTKLTKNIWSLHTFSTKLTIKSVNHHEKPTILGNMVCFPNQHFPSKTEANNPLPPSSNFAPGGWTEGVGTWRGNSRRSKGVATNVRKKNAMLGCPRNLVNG